MMAKPVNDLGREQGSDPATAPSDGHEGMSLLDVAVTLAERIRFLLAVPLAIGVLAFGASSLSHPIFTASTTFLPPQPPQSSAVSALASLGALAGLGGGSARTSADQYIALMQSSTVSDRIIDQFKLMQLREQELRVDARKSLAGSVRFSIGKKDGLITVEVDDESPQRAADIANSYVAELRRMTDTIAIGEAQQRRMFFEQQLQQTRDKLTRAQQALQASGLTEGTLKAEPRAAAEGYAQIKAEVTAAEVRLQTLRRSLADNAPEVQQQLAMLVALRAQLSKREQATEVSGGPDYVSKYREFKYQEVLFDLFARQYEAARADESREAALIQVIDPATPPERKSKPKRSIIALMAAFGSGLVLAASILARQAWRRSSEDPSTASRMARLRAAFGRHRR